MYLLTHSTPLDTDLAGRVFSCCMLLYPLPGERNAHACFTQSGACPNQSQVLGLYSCCSWDDAC